MLFFLAIVFPILFAALALMVPILLFSRLKQADQHLKLNQYRAKETAVPDKLNYQAVIDDGIILNKDGSLLAGFSYEAPDVDSSTATERNYISEMVNKAICRLGEGWVLHVNTSRYQVPNYAEKNKSHFGDNVTEAIDEERRHFFENHGALYETSFVFCLSWLPPELMKKKYSEIFYDDDDADNSPEKITNSNLRKFKEELSKFEDALSGFFKINRLKSYTVIQEDGREEKFDDLLEHLHHCITGENTPIRLPSDPSFVDYLVGSKEMWGGTVPYLGNKYIQVVSIDGYPNESVPGILNILTQLPIEYRWTSRLILLPHHVALSLFDKQRRMWRQQIYGMKAQFMNNKSNPNLDAAKMEADAIEALAETRSQEVTQAFFTSTIVLMSSDREELEEWSKFVAAQVNRTGFSARIEENNTMDAFFGSLPAHAVENVRRPIFNTRNIGDMLPTNASWSGNPKAPCDKYPINSPALMQCVTHGETPFYMNWHVEDVGHTLILGPTGAGKSVLLTIAEAQMRRYSGMTIFAFDKGMSMYPLCAAINAATDGKTGQHYEVGTANSGLSFAPLQFLDTPEDRAWAIGWIEDILRLNGEQITPQKTKSISTAIAKMSKMEGETSLSAFENIVDDLDIRAVLDPYVLGGEMKHLLSAETDSLAFSDFCVFEIEELMNLQDKYRMPVLLYLFRRIEKALTGQPARIILDEAWMVLENPVFRDKIREWLKVLRKANCGVVLATQSLSDIDGSGILDVLNESCKTKIFLPNPDAQNRKELYQKFGLNDRQIEIIAQAQQKREYYMVSDDGRRLFSLALGKFALSFVAVSDKNSIRRIKELRAEHGNQWVDRWLKERGVSWPANSNKIIDHNLEVA